MTSGEGKEERDPSRIFVSDLMSTEVVTAKPDQLAASVRNAMDTLKVSSMPIVDEAGTPIGIVTSLDLMRNLVPAVRVSSVMTERVHSVSPETTVSEAARLMRTKGIHHLIVEENEKIVGILSTFDLLRLIESSPSVETAIRRRPS